MRLRGRAQLLGWGLLAVGLAFLLLRERQALAATLVHWSDFTLLDDVYFSPGVKATERARVLADLERARARVTAFYGPLQAKPRLIAAAPETLARFTSNSTAATHYLPTKALIVLGPAGWNVDVIAHELAHAELLERLGYMTLQWCIPTWFDEGLAVQFDERPFYNQKALAQRLRAGWHLPPFSELEDRARFFAGGRDVVRFHYSGARAAVSAWLRHTHPTSSVRAVESLGCDAATREDLARIRL